MTTPPSSQTGVTESPTLTQEIKLIPRWSVALAVCAFVFMQYVYWIVLPAHGHHRSTTLLGVRVYFALSWSALAALYVLMIGYVSRDAPRRDMSTRFWTLICLVMPGGIGSVLYFLLRQPVLSVCPSCGTRIHSEFHFCPQCSYQISASCGNCYRSVRVTDLYCIHCGHNLSTDNAPARLRAFRS